MLRCQCPSVHLSDPYDPYLPRIAVAVHAGACTELFMGAREGIIAGKSGGIISRYASHC